MGTHYSLQLANEICRLAHSEEPQKGLEQNADIKQKRGSFDVLDTKLILQRLDLGFVFFINIFISEHRVHVREMQRREIGNARAHRQDYLLLALILVCVIENLRSWPDKTFHP